MPIGNLTSQIFANIYLNEFDRFVKHILEPKAYLRYGDDFIMIEPDVQKLRIMRMRASEFLRHELKLSLHAKNDVIFRTRDGHKFLGVVLWPWGRKLNKRNKKRIRERPSLHNAASYYGILKNHANQKRMNEFHWRICEKLLYNASDAKASISFCGPAYCGR